MKEYLRRLFYHDQSLQMFLLVAIICCLMPHLYATTCTQYDYSSDSSVTVSNYNQLNCAIQDKVPHIFVNQTIPFMNEIVLPSRANITIQGSYDSIELQAAHNYRLFNVTDAQLSINNLILIGDLLSSVTNGGLIVSEFGSLHFLKTTAQQSTASCGSVVYAKNTTVVVKNSVIGNNTAVDQSCGGSFYISGGSLSVQSTTFQYNEAASGGAIYAQFSNIDVIGSKFRNNKATINDGGALHISDSTTVQFSSTTFASNTALGSAGSGGSISLTNIRNAVVKNCSFASDIASNYGGSIYSTNSSVMVSQVFVSFANGGNGGGLALNGVGTIDIISSSFVGNQGSNAGAIYCAGGSGGATFLNVSSSTFTGNQAINSGGAFEVASSCVVNIVDSELTGNTASFSNTPISIGGGLSCQYGNVSILRSEIRNSQAVQGSAIYLFFCSFQFLSSTIRDSTAGDGSIYGAQNNFLLVQDSTFFNNTGTTASSAIICLYAETCDIISSTFTNNSAAQLGVIQATDSPTATISSCQFYSNKASGISGAVYFNGVKKGVITNSKFYSNSATTYGGSLAILQSTVTINSSFIQNSLANSGGGLYVFQSGRVIMQNCTFQSNTALDSGGAIYIGDQSSLVGNMITIESCSGPYGGGVYMSYQSSATINVLTAKNNSAGYSGGVFGLFDYSRIELQNSNLIGNSAFLGGAISLQYYCSAIISNSNINLNDANSYGGAAYVLVSSSLVLTNSSLNSNSGKFGGGAFLIETSSLNVTNSNINQHSGNIGAGIYAISGDIQISSTKFYSNGGSTYEGGTVYLSAESTYSSYKCNYSSNQAEYGGVIAIVQSSFLSSFDSFEKCSGLTGPCLYAVQNSSVALEHSTIANNYQITSSDGLFYIDSGSLYLNQISAVGNVIQSNGIFGLYSVSTSIVNSNFTNNVALLPGATAGAIYIACTSPCRASNTLTTIIRGSRFTQNVATDGDGGAIYVSSYPGDVLIESCTFIKNQGKNGGAISVDVSTVTVTSSVFRDNIASEGGGGIFWIYSSKYRTTVDKKSTNEGNEASYGNFTATDLVKLNSYFPADYRPVSGKALNQSIEIYLLDYYGQIIRNSSLYTEASVTVYCSVYKDSGVVKGSSTVPSEHGIATFSQIVVTGVPGGNTTLVFSVPISSINVTYQTIHFRDCISGEITTSVGNNLYTCETCELGTYSFYPTDIACNICPSNAYCPGGNVIDVNAGYWRTDQVSANILQCPQPDPCLGGTNTSSQCSSGSYGPYCSLCDEGYTASRSGVCYACSNSTDTANESISTVLFIVLSFMVFLIYKYRKKIAATYTSAWTSLLKNRKFRTLRVKGKIIVAFCQIVYQLGPALNIVFPFSFLEFLNYYAIFQLNILIIPDVSCVVHTNYYDSLLISTISPFIVFLIVVLVVQFLVVRARRLNERNPSYKGEQATRDIITAAFLISYFVMVDVSTQVFRVFQCEHFDDGSSYLVADYSIDCNAPDRSFYVAYGSVMIFVYPIGIPLAYAIVLFSYRKKINPDWRKVIDKNEKVFVSNRVIQQEKIKVRNTYSEIDNIRNLFDSYTPKRWYFELFDCARRLCLGAVPVLIFRGSALQIIIVLLVSLFSVASFMYFNPYIHEHDNHLAILSQWSITLIVIAALIIKVEAVSSNNQNTEGLGVVLIFLNVIIVAFAIVLAIVNSKETKDDEEKGLFGEDIEIEEDSEDEEGEGEGEGEGNEKGNEEGEGNEKELKKKKRKKNQKTRNKFSSDTSTNPLHGQKAPTSAELKEGDREADSDLGSDGEPDEDERSLDSDDDNYQERQRRKSRKDVESSGVNNEGEGDSHSKQNRSVLTRIFSGRAKNRLLNNPSQGGERTNSSSSSSGVELNTLQFQGKPIIEGQSSSQLKYTPEEAKLERKHLPSRGVIRDSNAAIDSDDEDS